MGRPIEMANLFATEVNFGRVTGNESAVMGGEITLAAAVKTIIKDMNYYLTMDDADMKVSGATIKQACAKCQGHGNIKTPRTFKTCPKCNGSGYPITLMTLSGLLTKGKTA
jgi:DnaJ-class molecular chaperone